MRKDEQYRRGRRSSLCRPAIEPPPRASGGQTLATTRATRGDHLAATDSGHAGAETMTALAHDFAGLISPFHRRSPQADEPPILFKTLSIRPCSSHDGGSWRAMDRPASTDREKAWRRPCWERRRAGHIEECAWTSQSLREATTICCGLSALPHTFGKRLDCPATIDSYRLMSPIPKYRRSVRRASRHRLSAAVALRIWAQRPRR